MQIAGMSVWLRLLVLTPAQLASKSPQIVGATIFVRIFMAVIVQSGALSIQRNQAKYLRQIAKDDLFFDRSVKPLWPSIAPITVS